MSEIREREPPFFFLHIRIIFVHKATNTITLVEVTLIILSIVLMRNLLVQLKETREESIICGSLRKGAGGFRVNNGMSATCTETVVELSDWIGYDYCSTGMEKSRGMYIMTVPDRSECVVGP